MAFFFDLFVNVLMIGSMYALVALGFVLIYKATSVVNFAQGDLVMFGGYIAAALVVLYKLPLAIALPVLLGSMIALGFIVERGVLRPMVGQNVISVVMVTIGLSQVFQGSAAMLWGAQTKSIPLPIPLEPYVIWEIYISPVNLVAALVSGVFLVAFAWFFRKSRMGIAMRATANDQQAAMAVGINVRFIFALSWAIAGWRPPSVESCGATSSAWTPSSRWWASRSSRPSSSVASTASLAPWSEASSSARSRAWPRATSIPTWAGAPRTSCPTSS